ncbi:pseudouridine synthase [Defluviimonas sp. SAOS-178_SWC]|uniref:pseudouridine synthase n=1 Tax=Defluviimonas sp. SAOS-178_SWC TaxID=3121287 RepID=UPI003221D26B
MAEEKTGGDRIAKVMARAGVASRRDAEKMIVEGRVAVNGVTVKSPALDVLPSDKVTLDGKPIDAPQPARLWLYYKPLGLVTSAKDEKGRQTVFDTMPADMPRVMSVGRLDLNSEGLLLLTNDGALKRRLELPSTGWLRKYRVRVNGRPNDATFDPLRRGVIIEGEEFQPMEVTLDVQKGANAWLTVGLREGKNREVRRAMAEVGLIVNRLIRVSYGPFRLNTMKPGDVVEVKQKVLRDQLGDRPAQDDDKPAARRDGDRKPRMTRDGKPAKPRAPREGSDAPRDRKAFKPRGDRPTDDRKPREGGKPFRPRAAAAAGGPGDRTESDRPRKARPPRDGDRPFKPRQVRDGDAPAQERGERPFKPRPPRDGDSLTGNRPYKQRSPRGDDAPARGKGDRPYKARPPREDATAPRGERPQKPRPPRDGDAGRQDRGGPRGKGGSGGKPFAGKPSPSRSGPGGPRKGGDRPSGGPRRGGPGPKK